MTDTIISTPHALVQTTNGKRFYVFSGEQTIATGEVEVIDIDNIGERDIIFSMYVGSSAFDSDNYHLKVKSNGVTVYRSFYDAVHQTFPTGYSKLKLLFPANTSLTITLQLSGGSHSMTVACYGKYLSM